MWGEHDSLDYKVHPKIFPTIIIDEDFKNLTYVYSQHNMKWEKEYKIMLLNGNYLVGTKAFQENFVDIIHYEITTGKFNIFFSGDSASTFGNTMSTGRCFN